MAWLSAIPEKAESPRRSQYAEDSPVLAPHPLSLYESHLSQLWHECGTVGSNGMGITALSWAEIVIWADKFYSETIVEWIEEPFDRLVLNDKNEWIVCPIKQKSPITFKQCTLLDYELEIIRFLSREYADEYSEARNPSRPCPKITDVAEVSKEIAMSESMGLKEMLLAMKKS